MKLTLSIVLTLAMVGGLFTGCGKSIGTADYKLPKGKVSYPITTTEKLKYWVPLNSSIGTLVKNYGETPLAKEYEKRTGIKVEFLHPAQGQEEQSINLLLASGDLPDIVQTNWLSKDPDTMIRNKIILKLNDIYQNYAPNLYKYLNGNPDISKAVKTDQDSYYGFPFIRSDESLLTSAGYMVRDDIMKELGVTYPETIAEWDVMLEKLKTKFEFPITVNSDILYFLAGGFGVINNFFVENDKVKYGPIEPGFKGYLAKMAEWYKKGYIDPNFATNDTKLINANMIKGKSAITWGGGGGTLGLLIHSVVSTNPKFNLRGINYPAVANGQKPMFGNRQLPYVAGSTAAITVKCKSPDVAARYLDYAYSPEGHMLMNFGIENTSYTIQNGEPIYTDLIIKNPNGLSMAQVMPLYIKASSEGPFIQDKRYITQYYALPQQKEALLRWSDVEQAKYSMPQITLTKEEITTNNSIMSNLSTLKNETFINIILGKISVNSGFDGFIQKAKEIKIDEAIKIQQKAYERYKNRK